MKTSNRSKAITLSAACLITGLTTASLSTAYAEDNPFQDLQQEADVRGTLAHCVFNASGQQERTTCNQLAVERLKTLRGTESLVPSGLYFDWNPGGLGRDDDE